MMRKYGLTVDSLLSAEVVTADGDLVRASATENADLFWALRGGGGNFGVVTSFEFACHEVGDLVVLATFHRLDTAADMLRRADAAMADRRRPTSCSGPASSARRRRCRGCPRSWSGARRDVAHRVVRRHRRRARPPRRHPRRDVTGGLVAGRGAVPHDADMGDEVFRHGLHSYIKATFADELSDGLIDGALPRGVAGSPLAQVEVLSVGGAIARVPVEATAYVHRGARWLINIPASWEDPAETDDEVAWVRDTFAALQPHVSGGAYVNFMEADDVAADETAYGGTLARLQQVKATYDPQNVFTSTRTSPRR